MFSEMFSAEKANLESDAKAAYGWLSANWRRVITWYATYYVAQHGALQTKFQGILKAVGF